MINIKCLVSSLLFQAIAILGIIFLCHSLLPRELVFHEIPRIWIVLTILLALFTTGESYFVLTHFLVNIKKLLSLQKQKIYFIVLINISIFFLLNGVIMLYFANHKGVIICIIGLISLFAGIGWSLGIIKILYLYEQ